MAPPAAPAILREVIEAEFGGVLRQFADEVGIDHTILSRIFAGQRFFKGAYARRIMPHLSDRDRKRFVSALVEDYLGRPALKLLS